ncbi:histidine--tRNA ligase [Candidatus Adlerbacteria bacterium RIFCSPHIGHO2_01_FULL_54_23]|uniref:Histidine--tRNA ligase n=2 Tax=Candidatus Adleribacteriota TaxID=1752736 RepID=A0A0G1XWX4_9BACT|nr:MAG: Histidine-tRNA ligase [Candidatus Adlerbacteria bacterium GW2011_GWA1_54_10]KKW38081.1 MAG: Histidine-tRNA ligase [Candidatus Adlerbacteria bacterium GW2011_GWB1_54_7]OGC78787.1 MAG: histidine--tRNA ligase [Candidatus Adlerbacteria bacterium RIFCSPHIGHO2_01_FULL_54_23]
MSKNAAPNKEKRLSTEPYKGVRDFYPEDQSFLNYFFETCRRFVERVGYVEYHASVLEPSELYKAKGAENEEIIKDQTYTFIDRGGREVTLRPEMTPSVARMVAARRRDLGFPLRLYSMPNVFRYERPQRGRLREHWQLNVDCFGSRALAADAEIIGVAYGLMGAFGATERDFVIKIGDRAHFNDLVQKHSLSPEQSKKLFYILDRRAKAPEAEFKEGLMGLGIAQAELSPKEEPRDVAKIVEDFRNAGINNIIYAPEVVRGFNYYTGIVFEVFDAHPDNNRSLFGGGRYDNLTELFDDEPLPGVGFGMGDVTVRDFLAVRNMLPEYRPPTHLYIAVTSAELAPDAQSLAGELRRQGVNAAIDFGEKKLGDQIKAAGKHKIPWLLVFGQDEIATGRFSVRDMETGAEESLSRDELGAFFLNL